MASDSQGFEAFFRSKSSLQAWDLAVAVPEDRVAVGPAERDESAAPLVFFAALDDNSP